jgi:hypothetical protein
MTEWVVEMDRTGRPLRNGIWDGEGRRVLGWWTPLIEWLGCDAQEIIGDFLTWIYPCVIKNLKKVLQRCWAFVERARWLDAIAGGAPVPTADGRF